MNERSPSNTDCTVSAVSEESIQGMAALAFINTGMQKLSQLYDSAATPDRIVDPFLGNQRVLALALGDIAASEPAIRKGLRVLQTISSALKDGCLKQMV